MCIAVLRQGFDSLMNIYRPEWNLNREPFLSLVSPDIGIISHYAVEE